jgi:hypothetical protein
LEAEDFLPIEETIAFTNVTFDNGLDIEYTFGLLLSGKRGVPSKEGNGILINSDEDLTAILVRLDEIVRVLRAEPSNMS